MKIESIILQPMEDDYVDNIKLSRLLDIVRNPQKEMNEKGVYYCAVMINKVSSKTPYMSLVYSDPIGYALSIHELNPDTNKRVTYFAHIGSESNEVVKAVTARHTIQMPRSFFIPVDDAVEQTKYFCETGQHNKNYTFIPQNNLGFDVYVEK